MMPKHLHTGRMNERLISDINATGEDLWKGKSGEGWEKIEEVEGNGTLLEYCLWLLEVKANCVKRR